MITLENPHYEIKIGNITLYTDQKDFLDAMTYISATNQQKLAFNIMLDTNDLKIYQHTNHGKKLCWQNNLSEIEKEIAILTVTEKMILDLLEDGETLKTISYKMKKCIGSINHHLGSVKDKFNVKTTTSAVAKYAKLK